MFQELYDDIGNDSIFPTTTEGDIMYRDDTRVARLGIGDANTVLRTDGVVPEWDKVGLTADVTGTLPVANGGTGLASYTIGDLLYASAAAVLSKLADVSVGSYLRSGGVGAAPVWSTLKVPNAAAIGEVPYGSAADVLSMLAVGTDGDVLTTHGAGNPPTWETAASSTNMATVMTRVVLGI